MRSIQAVIAMTVILAAIWPTTGHSADDAAAGAPTFFADVLPLIQENCQVCHRPAGSNVMGMVAPMSFMTFAEVRPWAKSIARQVASREMPPWHAAPSLHGKFSNERTLTDGEIDTLVRWAASGAKRGLDQDAPATPEFTSAEGWTIGEPDLIVTFDKPYLVPDSISDHYVDLIARITEEQLPEDRWIQAMEFRPDSEAVHHIVIFTDDRRESLGFPMGMLGGMGPGTDPTVFPKDYGRLLRKGTSLRFNMHYHKEAGPGTAVVDASEIAFKFHDKPIKNEVLWGAVGTMNFNIPAGHDNWEVNASETFDKAVDILALFPHMHLRGKASKYVANYPDGTSEVLLDVPRYDFNWQTNYIYDEPKRLPAGTRLDVTMWYDNSAARADLAGIDSERDVRFGGPTTDEMMFGWIDYSYAEPGS